MSGGAKSLEGLYAVRLVAQLVEARRSWDLGVRVSVLSALAALLGDDVALEFLSRARLEVELLGQFMREFVEEVGEGNALAVPEDLGRMAEVLAELDRVEARLVASANKKYGKYISMALNV